MADYTENFDLEKQAGNDTVNIEGINNNFDIIDTEIKNAQDRAEQAFQSASNGKTLIADAITGKGVPTSASATFQTMANNIDAIETDPSIGTTDAVAADILAPKKAVSQGELRIGTMPDRGPTVAETVELTTQNQEYAIALGKHSGLRKVKAVIAGLVANVIAMGSTVGGIAGSYTSDATATAAQMLSGAIAYVKGIKITGTMVNRGAVAITPSTANQAIAAGYHNGSGSVAGSANLVPANIKDGVNIFGKVGTLKPAEPIVNIGSSAMSGLTLGIMPISNLNLTTNQIVDDAFIFRISTSSSSTLKLKVIGSVREFSTVYNDGDIIDLIAQRAIVLFSFTGGGVQVVSYTGTAPECSRYIAK